MSDKQKFPRGLGMEIFCELVRFFEGRASRLVAAGSLRRRKPEIGDLEILYIPKIGNAPDPADLFGSEVQTNLTDKLFSELLDANIISKRLNSKGNETWGESNKLAVHVESGLPIDFFATTKESYPNYLVCRTGGAETNQAICCAANRQGMKWCPYSPGFIKTENPKDDTWDTVPAGDRLTVRTEQDVFRIAGLDYLPPEERR